MHLLHRRTLAVVLARLLPAAAAAQDSTSATIVAVVRDTSGAVLPGVTVEAASPALIERVRSVVSDQAGRFRIKILRPGAYSVTFTLPGFMTVRRGAAPRGRRFVDICRPVS